MTYHVTTLTCVVSFSRPVTATPYLTDRLSSQTDPSVRFCTIRNPLNTISNCMQRKNVLPVSFHNQIVFQHYDTIHMRGGAVAATREEEDDDAEGKEEVNRMHVNDFHDFAPNRPSNSVAVRWKKARNSSQVYLKNRYTCYLSLVGRKPIITKSITCGIVSAIGDILSQYVAWKSSSVSTVFSVDWHRFNAFFISGTAFVGPYIHFWYEVLWSLGRILEQRFHCTKGKQILALNIVDQTFGVALFFPLYFYVYECIDALCSFRVPNLQTVSFKLSQELIPVLIMQYKVWPLTNWINFTYVPEQLRVLVSNVAAVIWNIYFFSRVA